MSNYFIYTRTGQTKWDVKVRDDNGMYIAAYAGTEDKLPQVFKNRIAMLNMAIAEEPAIRDLTQSRTVNGIGTLNRTSIEERESKVGSTQVTFFEYVFKELDDAEIQPGELERLDIVKTTK